MNRIIVDGFNTIYAADDTRKAILERPEPDEAMRLLEGQLAAYCSGRRGVRAVVVYDGEPPLGGRSSYPHVNVKFAPDADGEVVRLARKFAGSGDSVRVVSSDRSGVQQPLAGVKGVQVMGAGTFWQEVIGKGAGGGGGGPDDSGGKPSPPQGKELEYWKREFGVEEE